jgi:hypothetical protein
MLLGPGRTVLMWRGRPHRYIGDRCLLLHRRDLRVKTSAGVRLHRGLLGHHHPLALLGLLRTLLLGPSM